MYIGKTGGEMGDLSHMENLRFEYGEYAVSYIIWRIWVLNLDGYMPSPGSTTPSAVPWQTSAGVVAYLPLLSWARNAPSAPLSAGHPLKQTQPPR